MVATAASGIREVVAHGVGGLLSAPGDVAAMVDALERLIGDERLRSAMGRGAAQHAQRYDWEASGELMLGHYFEHAQAVPPSRDGSRPPPPLWERLRARWNPTRPVPRPKSAK